MANYIDYSHQPATNNAYGQYTFDVAASALLAAHPPVEPTICWQLWEVRQAYFYKLCLRWLNNNQGDADDAFNTTALAVWRQTHAQPSTLGNPSIGNPMGWLTGVARHTCLDLHRKRQKEAKQSVEIDDSDAKVWADAPSASMHSHSPEALFLQREQCVYLHEEIAALPVRLRVPFTLRCCEELSYEVIAAQLGLAMPTVRKRVQEARTILEQKLRTYLRGQSGPDLHAPWPDAQSLFTVPRPVASPTSDAEAVALQPRVTPLAQVSKREEQKASTLRAYVAAYPNGWKKRLELADQLCKMGIEREAIIMYEQVLEKQPQLLSVWIQVGRLYLALQHNGAAIVAYQRALALAATETMRDALASLIKGVLADAK